MRCKVPPIRTNLQNQKGDVRSRIVWVCIAHQKDKTKCGMKPLKEDVNQHAFVGAVNTHVADKIQFSKSILTEIEATVSRKQDTSKAHLQAILESTQEELIQVSQSTPSTDNDRRAKELMDKIESIQGKLELANTDMATHEVNILRLEQMRKLISKPLTAFNDTIFRTIVDRVLITATENRPTQAKFIMANREVVQRL